MTGTGTQRLIWSPAEKPVSIHVNSAIFSRMHLRTRGDGSRAVESGGLLLGYARQVGERWLIAVEEALDIPGRNALSESWTPDRDALESALAKWSANRRGDLPHTVGWYRTHSRPGLFLDEADFRLFRDYFPPPGNVALLASGDTGGFFFWEEDEVQRSRPYETFPIPAVSGVVPAPVRLPDAAGRLRPVWLAVPVVAGVVLGLMWNPDPLKPRVSGVRVSEAPNTEADSARAVFGPPPEEVAAQPPSEVPATDDSNNVSRARSVAPATRRPAETSPRRVAAIPKPRMTAAEPAMDFEAPQMAAVANVDRAIIPQREAPIVRTELEPSKPSAVRRVVGSIPGLGFLKRRKPAVEAERYTPPKVVREIRPTSPEGLAEEVGVRVRVLLSADGQIERTELLTRKVQPEVARAALEAAQRWRFEPARMDERPVASELVLQFRFPSAGGGGT